MGTISEDNWVSDLELMHHYTEVAYCTFSFSPSTYPTLQHNVPREALSSKPLLHQILAYAAFHLAYLHPNAGFTYHYRATQHQAKAIGSIREALNKPLTAQNCHCLYASSVFLIIGSFSTFPCHERYNPSFLPIERLCDIFALIDGMAVILNTSESDLRSGPLKGLFSRPSADCDPSSCYNHLQEIGNHLEALVPLLLEASQNLPQDDKRNIMDAASSLYNGLFGLRRASVSASMAQLKAVFLWPIRVPNGYVNLLRQRHPISLLIIPFYCLLLSYAQRNCWFLEGWSMALLTAVEKELVDTAYTHFISWPKAMIYELSKSEELR